MTNAEIEQLVDERMADESYRKYLACGEKHQWGRPENDKTLGWSQQCAGCGCWKLSEPLN